MRFKTTKVVKKLQYKGFVLSIMNNCAYDFKFEYQIESNNLQNKYILKQEIKPIKKFLNQRFDVVCDPTSRKTKADALRYGKRNINELRYRMSCPRLRFD